MRRRDFVLGSAAAWLQPLRPSPRSEGDPTKTQPSGDIYLRLVQANDAQIPALLQRQERRPGLRGTGGIPDEYGIPSAGATAGFIKMLSAAFAAPESNHRNSPELVSAMRAAAEFLLRVQHRDGTIDLHTTNFHSTPDAAFVSEPLAAAVHVVQSIGSPDLATLLERLKEFLLAAGEALSVGGIHTPNHRWVVCAALARIHTLWPAKKYVRRIDEWLAEGIDIDADGQYTERSTSVYSPITDSVLLTVARLLDRKALRDPVRRNLEMTLYYLHPDGEVSTEGSRRQDQFSRGSASGYYLPYRWMAIEETNGRFAEVARLIEQIAPERLTGNLLNFIEDPLLRRDLPASEPLPSDYSKIFIHSQLARIRRGKMSATVLADNPVFFTFRKEAAVLEGLRMAAAFFGKAQFHAAALEGNEGRYLLEQRLTGPYYQPLPPRLRRADGNWDRVDRSLRKQSEVQNLRMSARIQEKSGGFEIAIEIDGCDHVPVCLELGFRSGGELSGVTPVQGITDAWFLTDGTGSYRLGESTLEFGPGRADHRWTQLRGALPKLNAQCVYITGFTPFRHTLRIS